MRGSGKTAIGRLVAARRGLPFYDVDDAVERAAESTISEIFAVEGEEAFRELEAATLRQIADAEPGVIATGGGAVLRDDNVALMRQSGTVVLLRASPAELADRLAGSSDRPLLSGPRRADRLSELLASRVEAYTRAAHITIDTDGLEPASIADRIEQACGI